LNGAVYYLLEPPALSQQLNETGTSLRQTEKADGLLEREEVSASGMEWM
jgi:hypothetical protein